MTRILGEPSDIETKVRFCPFLVVYLGLGAKYRFC